jgi:hypothetical protein
MVTNVVGPQDIDSELKKAFEHAQRLLDASINVVGATHIRPNEQRPRDPRVIALALLCRSISNFRAAIRLVQQEQVMEARALVRLLCENLLWLGALRERGSDFVNAIVSDDRYKQKVLAQITMKLTSKHGGDVNSPDASTLRKIIKRLNENSDDKPLHADGIAAAGVVELAYVDYVRFSLEAVHCSATALSRHIARERSETTDVLTISVIPNASSRDVFFTVLHGCSALSGAAVAANEIVGFTAASNEIAALAKKFESNGWTRFL